MKISLLPKSHMGTWSVRLSIFFILTSIFLYVFGELSRVITSDMLISIVAATSIIAQIIAFILGITAVIKNKERSSMVFLAILLGLVVSGFILGDMLGLISH